jgi:hypothetical protein
MRKLILTSVIFTFSTFAQADGYTNSNKMTNWAKYSRMAQNAPVLSIESNKDILINKEKLLLNVDVNDDGYFYLFSIDKKTDKVTVLFPNNYDRNNKVTAGKFTFPTEQMRFDLKVTPPFGKSLLIAVLNPKSYPLSAGRKSLVSDDANEVFLELSNQESEQLSKSIAVFSKPSPHVIKKPIENSVKMGAKEVLTCETAEQC